MRFFMLTVVSAQPFYQETLRQLPEKLRQERIHERIQQKVQFIQHVIVEEAYNNRTQLNFTLFCFDPNLQYRDTVNHGYQRFREEFPGQSLLDIQDTGGRPYYAYQRDGPRYRSSSELDQHIKTDLIVPRPYCHAKHGYELYQRLYGKLEDSPQAYATLFFQKLNRLFPDIHLAVSNHRPSEGPYDSDCCPLFTVSW
jgi:hypothetical protein